MRYSSSSGAALLYRSPPKGPSVHLNDQISNAGLFQLLHSSISNCLIHYALQHVHIQSLTAVSTLFSPSNLLLTSAFSRVGSPCTTPYNIFSYRYPPEIQPRISCLVHYLHFYNQSPSNGLQPFFSCQLCKLCEMAVRSFRTRAFSPANDFTLQPKWHDGVFVIN